MFLALGLLNGCAKSTPQELMLFDFEKDSDLDHLEWRCHTLYSLSSNHVTHGAKSLKIDMFPSDYPGLRASLPIKDWRAYDALSFDIYNPARQAVLVGVRIDDKKEYPKYENRYSESFVVAPGQNQVVIRLKTMLTKNAKRHLDLSHIYRLYIFVSHPATRLTLYVDALKLTKGVSSTH